MARICRRLFDGDCLALLAPSVAVTQEMDAADKAIKARQGLMDIIVWEAGPLFGMAKGEVEYDAAAAQAAADNLHALVQYNAGRLFVSGSSKEDKPGKTRALPKIWEDLNGFTKAYGDLQAATDNLAAEAGKGKDEFTAAVGELGKACGGCHKPYRADEF